MTMRIGIACCAVVVSVASVLSGQNSREAQRVRVPTGHANVHMGPNSTSEVLVLVRRDTVLEVD
jgi:hypothetical protein